MRDEPLRLLGGGGTNVGRLLLFRGVYVDVLRPGVLADDHTLVDFGAGADKQRPPLLQVDQGVGGTLAAAVRDKAAGGTGAQVAVPWLVPLEDVVQDAGAARFGQELCVKADKGARRDKVFLAHPASPVVDHLLKASFAQGQQLCDHAEVVLGDVDRQPFHRLAEFSVHQLRDDLWLADGQFEPLAAHRLNQDRQLKLASSLHFPGVRPVCRTHSDGDVTHHFRIQPVLDETRGQPRSSGSRHWRSVNPDGH